MLVSSWTQLYLPIEILVHLDCYQAVILIWITSRKCQKIGLSAITIIKWRCSALGLWSSCGTRLDATYDAVVTNVDNMCSHGRPFHFSRSFN